VATLHNAASTEPWNRLFFIMYPNYVMLLVVYNCRARTWPTG